MASKYELDFKLKWRAIKGPKLEEEYKFYPDRRWRVDFCHVESRTIIECEGGCWIQGRHTRGSGFEKDCEKYNTATMEGWAVIRLTPKYINLDFLNKIKAFMIQRQNKV